MVRTRALSTTLIAGACFVSASAQAQQNAPDDAANTGLEEIIVTAQKQAQSQQDVPISVTAVTGEALQEAQVNNIADLSNSIPNVQINTFSNSPDSAVFTIRGVGVNDADPYVGTTVSVVVDGVVVGVNTAALLSLFDIDRVEVLRGPQGTLFGANTTGGVINVVTKQPTGEFGGDIEAVYGNYGHLELNGALNVPLTENLSGKISVLHNEMDGYFRNYADNRRIGKRNITTLRGYLKYDRGDYDATLIGEYVRSRNGSQTGILIAGPGELFYTPGETTDPFDFKRGLSSDQPDSNDRDSYAITLTQNLTSGIGDLTSITSYREYDNELFSDDDATTRVLLQTRRRTKHHQFSQELRDLIDLSDTTRLILGGYYFRQRYTLDQQGKLDGFLPGLGQPQTQAQTNWSLSGFAQLYQDLTGSLRLQAGIRYSHEKTEATSTTANTINPSGVATFNDPLIPGSLIVASGKESWNNVGWKVGLDYRVDPDVMLYGYYARGFKSGGFTGRIAIAQDIGPFDPEKLDTIEGGIKADLLDRHLRVNLAAFYNWYSDMQVVQNITYPSGANSASIANAGSARTKGFELEVTAIPVTGLTLTGALAYLDAKYKEYDTQVLDPVTGGLVPISYAGNRLMNAPKWNAALGVNWKQPLANGTLSTTGQYTYTSAKFTSYTNLPVERVGPVELVNASINWGPDDAGWTVGAFARNLLDEEYFNQKLNLAGIGTLASLGTPREYGVNFRYSF
ncbi:TonB-dependent receptor [Novosphingobium aquimarinum]|uniref:TonB-dependent receptor n=1 Tax=Novosphingobium aquimarinum TaxID=2682494 RepID=UPI0018DCCB96|nr:TonB-dependent receptor [Novosphingobium aquimarinum]